MKISQKETKKIKKWWPAGSKKDPLIWEVDGRLCIQHKGSYYLLADNGQIEISAKWPSGSAYLAWADIQSHISELSKKQLQRLLLIYGALCPAE